MADTELAAQTKAPSLPVNAQAMLDLTLIGTKLKMGFSKIGDINTFIIIPISKEPSEGMTIDQMIKEINDLLKGYDPSLESGLKNEDISGAIKDVNEGANTKKGQDVTPLDYKSIRISLRQAFLLIATGKPVEFALEIDVDLTGLFNPEQSFINVGKLSLAVWNTNRQKIIKMMNIVVLDKLLDSDDE